MNTLNTLTALMEVINRTEKSAILPSGECLARMNATPDPSGKIKKVKTHSFEKYQYFVLSTKKSL